MTWGNVDLSKANTKVKCIKDFVDSVVAFKQGKVYPCVNNLGDGYWYAQREDQCDDNVVFINGPKPGSQEFFDEYFVVEEDHIDAYDRAMRIV